MKTHVYGKVVLFSFIGCFPCFFKYLFLIILFLHVFFFFMPFSVSVGKKLKNTENRRFWLSCFVFLYRVLSMLFSVLVPSTPINIQKALFWKSRFLSSYRVQKHILVVFSKTSKCMQSKLYGRNKQKRVFWMFSVVYVPKH